MKKALRYLSFMLCAVMLLCAVACGDESGDPAQVDSWRTDVEVSAVVDAVKGKTAAASMLNEQDQTVLELETDIDLTLCTAFAMYMTDSTLDEFGVFRAKDEASAQAVETALKSYLQ